MTLSESLVTSELDAWKAHARSGDDVTVTSRTQNGALGGNKRSKALGVGDGAQSGDALFEVRTVLGRCTGIESR